MRGRSQVVVAVLMAYAVMAILVSPAVPSPLGTVPAKHTVQPPQVILPFAALLLSTAIVNSNPLHEVVLAPPVHLGANGCDVVSLNVARLC